MRAMHPPGTGRPKVLPWMVHLATNTNFIAKIKLNESEPMIRFFWPWFGPCFITRHEKPWLKPYHRPLLHEDTNNGQYQCRRKTCMVHQTFVWWAVYIPYKFVKSPIRHLGLAIGNVRCVRCFSPTLQYSEISILVTVLQLSGHPVAKCNLWNDRATQILPNTGPTGNPRIPFAKVHVVPDDAAMLDVWLSNYAYFFQYFYVGPPKICVEHPTYTINWVVLWVTQDSSLAAALILVIFNWFHGLSRSLIDGRPRTDADHQTTTMGSPMDDSGFWHFLQHWSGDP